MYMKIPNYNAEAIIKLTILSTLTIQNRSFLPLRYVVIDVRYEVDEMFQRIFASVVLEWQDMPEKCMVTASLSSGA
jgi:hypothetical protein